MGISVDTVAENAAMVDKLRLPFALLSDPTAAAIAAWDVYDPVGGTHGPIARPAIFVVARDLTIPYEYVGRDFADRPSDADFYAALDLAASASPRPLAKTDLPPGPRPLDAGDPDDRPYSIDSLGPYFRGASFAVQALAGRTEDRAVKAEAARYRAMVAEFGKAVTATRRMTEGA